MSKLILAAAAAVLLAGPALAQEVAPSQTLSTRGVDFNNQAAVQHFYGKLWRAAYAVCDSGSVNPRIAQADLSCVRAAMAQAVRTIDAPILTAMVGRAYGGEAQVFQASTK